MKASKQNPLVKSMDGKEETSALNDPTMDVDESAELSKTTQIGKQIRGIVFGRGNMKKSFYSKSSDWHRREMSKSDTSVLENSQLSTDLMSSLPSEEMS